MLLRPVRGLRPMAVVFVLNSVVSYYLIQSALPRTLEWLDARHDGWRGRKTLQSFDSSEPGGVDTGGIPAMAGHTAAMFSSSSVGEPVQRRGDEQERTRAQMETNSETAGVPHAAATAVHSAITVENGDGGGVFMGKKSEEGTTGLDIRPRRLSSRHNLHVPMMHFRAVGMAAEEEKEIPNAIYVKSESASEDGNAGKDSSPRARPVRDPSAGSSVPGGTFDYAGPTGKYWARAFYFDEHSIGAVLLRPPRAQRRQICKYQGMNANTMDFKGSMGESHGAPVDKLTVICRFNEAIKRPNPGDVIELWDDSEVPIFAYETAQPFGWTVCTPPLSGSIRHEWVSQVLRYYVHKLSVDYFFFYSAVAGTTASELTKLGVDLADKYASVIDISSQAEYKPYFFGHTTAIHDCLFLNRHLKTEWVLYQDLDEVIVVPEKWPDPLAFFESFKDKNAVTLGMWSVDSRVCRPESEVEPEDEEWPLIARMKKSTRGPYCGNMCIDWRGRRKYALRPLRVDALFIHKPIARPLVNLPVTDGFLRNFWRAQSKELQVCAQVDNSPKKKS